MSNISTEAKSLYEPPMIDPSQLLALMDQRLICEVLPVALRLEVFYSLKQYKTTQALAAERDWHEETTARFLNLLRHMGYLEVTPEGYKNSPVASTYLVPESFLYLGHKLGEQVCAGTFGFDLIRCLEKDPETRVSKEPDWTHERLRQIGVNALNGSLQSTVNACCLEDIASLLDLGGGHGFYSIAFAQKYPRLNITLLDLPQVITLTRQFVDKFQLAERINAVAGNFLHDDLGTGCYDAILCFNILHSDKRDVVLAKVRRALRRDGKIILKCRIADCPDTLTNAFNKLYWQVRGGKELFTQDQWRGFLRDHGFKNIRTVYIDGMFATMIGIAG